MIMRFFGFLAVLGLIAGASTGVLAQSPAPKPTPKKVTVKYICSGLKLQAVYDNVKDRVSFVWGAKDYHLPHVASADGARYAGPTLQWWEKGNTVTLSTMPEQTLLATCTVRT